MALLLGIDLGTSYFKIGLFDARGEVRGLARVPVHKLAPAPGWSELPVKEFWRALHSGVDEALAQSGASPREIGALSYSSQASTFVLLGRDAQPLTPLVMWTDTRGGPVEDALQAFAQTEVFRRTVGFEGLSPYAAVAKWRWFQRHEPEVWSRVERIMTISDYFTFALTGQHAGDASTAAFLGLYDLANRRWWPEALREFGIETAMLSSLLPPGSSCGCTQVGASDLIGVPAGIPFAVGALDHHAAAIGSGLGSLADLSISTGTVLAALVLVEAAEPLPGCYHGPHTDGRRFYRLAFDPNGAGQLEEYQRRHAPEHTIEQLLALAENVSAGGTVPGAEHGAAVRNILERVSSTHARLVGTVLNGNRVNAVVATGGGARSPLWLQISADMLGVPIVTPTCLERACLGAAAFAAVAAGIYPALDDALREMVHRGRVYEPKPEAAAPRTSRPKSS